MITKRKNMYLDWNQRPCQVKDTAQNEVSQQRDSKGTAAGGWQGDGSRGREQQGEQGNNRKQKEVRNNQIVVLKKGKCT